MRTEITAKGLDLTEPIEAHARTKSEKLLQRFNGVQEIEIVLKYAEHENLFQTEIIADVVKHDPFVAKAANGDIYASIDQAIERAVRQLTDHKEKLRDHR